MATITISPLCPSEIDELIPLAYRIWLSHYPGIISVEQIHYMLERGYSRQLILDELEQGIIWLKIMAGTTMVGFASVGPFGEDTMKLHKLYLLQEFHGTGIGGRALAEVERIVNKFRIGKLLLNVNKYNSKAIKAYQRGGWQIVEEVRVDIGGGFIMDDFVMTKEIG
ncbi:MAG TPA: GNAT family N-acetyltransferase [Desulfuromonadaceae bacterium]|jgi:GNAT superfamily N-acetyltransferase